MALEKMTMPQLGESVTEGTISKWLVSVGDQVEKYEPIAEVMTDKVTAEIPSSFAGIIKELVAEEGETLPVGQVICTIETESGDVQIETTPSTTTKDSISDKIEEKDTSQKYRYSPAVLKLAREHGIDLTKVKGTGKHGRITRKDLLKIIESGHIPKETEEKVMQPVEPEKQRETVATATLDIPKQVQPAQHGDVEIPVSGLRKTIAANMVRSKQEIPHAWTMVEADVTNLVSYRDEVKDKFYQQEGYKLTYFAFFVKAVAQALKEFPQLNSTWAGDKIIQRKDINLSIAVATDDALFVPVIKHADEKSIKGIAREIQELADKARNGKLTMDDISGGTFTVNNTGSFGSIQSMGIINYPQAAILQVESIRKELRVMKDGSFQVRDMVNLCLSLDHRVLDGLICGRFLQRVKEILENINRENTPIF